MKKMLIIKASEDIADAEIMNIVSQVAMYGINAEIQLVDCYDTMNRICFSGEQYDYIYLASHGCETSFGNISGSVDISWPLFGATACTSGVAKPGAIFMHSCCRGGLNQVAWQMFACCPKIDFVCGPRTNVLPVDLITAFNLFLYNVEVKRINPVRAAEKVEAATDVRLICYDQLEIQSDVSYQGFRNSIYPQIGNAFRQVDETFLKLHTVPAKVVDLSESIGYSTMVETSS